MDREQPEGRPEPAGGAPRASASASEPADPDPNEEIPLGQRLYERPFLLLAVGIVVMLVFYTGWGLWEVASLSEAPLP